jgi:hypothetical protein
MNIGRVGRHGPEWIPAWGMRSHRGALDHLGDLVGAWLYRNDRQIKAVTYRETEADRVSYTVTIKEL